MTKTIIQVFPKIKTGGLERGAIDNAIDVARRGYHSIVIASSHDKYLEKKLKVASVEVISLEVGKKSILRAFSTVLTLRSLFNKFKPDCIHARSRWPIWMCYFALKKTHYPFVTSCHGVHDDGFLGLKKIYNRAITVGDSVVFPSISMKEHYKKRFSFDDERTYILPPSVDAELFSKDNVNQQEKNKLLESWQIDFDKKVVLLPGRVTGWKGQMLMIEAFHLLPCEIKQSTQLVILGAIEDESYYQSCLEKIKLYKLSSAVGFQRPTHHIREAYALSDVVVSASVEPESFGRITREAMSMEKLVISTNIGGSSEAITHGVNGFLSAVDAKDLSNKIIEALSLSMQDYEAIATSARESINSLSRKKASSALIEEVYTQATWKC